MSDTFEVSDTSLGQTCASATPNAGCSATTRSVTASAVNAPSTEKPTTVTSGPSTSSSTSARPLRAAVRARSIASGSSAGSSTSVSPFWPCRSGAFTTTGPATSGGSSSPPTTHQRGCGTPASPRRSRCRSLLVASTAVAGSIGCGRPLRSATRAATPTGQSVPGETIPSISSAVIRRSIAGSSSVERMQRRSAKRKPGRGRVTIDDGDPEAAIVRGLQQPELCGTRA